MEINYDKLAKALLKASDGQVLNNNTNDKKEKPQQQERVVSHPYNYYKTVLIKMTAKELSTYINKKDFKSNAFPVNYEIGRNLFAKFEIGGRPWVAYDEQINHIIPQLMDFYKYTKSSKITKYNECIKYLKDRIKAVNKDSKLKTQHKKHRLLSLQTAINLIENKLEEL